MNSPFARSQYIKPLLFYAAHKLVISNKIARVKKKSTRDGGATYSGVTSLENISLLLYDVRCEYVSTAVCHYGVPCSAVNHSLAITVSAVSVLRLVYKNTLSKNILFL